MKLNKKALYVEVYEKIYEWIENKELLPGDRLPGEVALSKKLNVSRSTLRQALLILKENGIIYNRQGSGNFVAQYEDKPMPGLDRLVHIPLAFKKQPLNEEVLKIVYEVPTKYIADKLQLNQSSIVMNCHKAYKVDEQMVAYSLYMIPLSILESNRIDLNNENEITNFIDHKLMDITTKSEAHVVYTKAGEFLHDLMKIKLNEPIILIDEVYQNDMGKPITTIRHSMHPEYFDFFVSRYNL